MTDTAAATTPWDELLDGAGRPRAAAAELVALIERLGVEELQPGEWRELSAEEVAGLRRAVGLA